MAITQRDVMLLFTMGLAVVSMSFVFPALGMGGDQVAENDVPELNVDANTIDLTGDFPEAPGGPDSGTLTWRDNRSAQFNQVYPRGDTTDGIEIGLLPPTSTRPLQIIITDWTSSTVEYSQRFNFTAVGEQATFANDSLGMTATFEVTEYDNTTGTYAIRYEIKSIDTQNTGWIENIPVLGAAAEGTLAVASVLGWLVEVFAWGSLYLIEQLANIFVVTATVGIYFINLLTWLATTYTAIISAADSWAAVFVALPGILLSAVLGKFVLAAFGR